MRSKKFHKMWEAADTFVFDIGVGSILPILYSLPKVASFRDKDFFFYYENGMGAAYYEEGEMKKAAKSGLKDFSSKDYQAKYFKGVKSALKSEEASFQSIEDVNIKNVSDLKLKSLLNSVIDATVDNFGYYLACQPQCVADIEKLAQKELAKVINKELVREAFTLLSTSTDETKLKREEKDWLKLLLEHKKKDINQRKSNQLIENHYKKYFLINAADGHDPWAIKHFQKKLKNDLKSTEKDLGMKLKKLDKPLQETKQQKDEFIRLNNIPNRIREVCDLLAKIGHWRLELRFAWMAAYYYNKLILNEVSRRYLGNNYLIRFATTSEISSLFHGERLDLGELKKRKDAFIFIIEGDKSYVLSGDDARKKFAESVPKIDYSLVSEFKGNIAMKGKVTGVVVVFKWGDGMIKKLKSMPDNAILVAGQTRPQLMPLIIKSQAIITDEGGITSHAAIVARELKKPCIIGTKIATQVLRDGDLVEVDAIKGIVKVIKKASK